MNWTEISCIAGRFLTSWATWEAIKQLYINLYIYIFIYIYKKLLQAIKHYKYWITKQFFQIVTAMRRMKIEDKIFTLSVLFCIICWWTRWPGWRRVSRLSSSEVWLKVGKPGVLQSLGLQSQTQLGNWAT